MLLQGLAEIFRCILCLRDGVWPPRLQMSRSWNPPSLPRRRTASASKTSARGGFAMMFTNPEIGMIQLAVFIIIILLGFPIAFTLVAMGVFFGYYAMGPRIFDLLVTNTYDVMSNDVLTAVPLFLFMGYVVERSNILDRLFYSLQMAMRECPGSLAVATLITCALFATATGIVGAVVTLMGLLAFPAMLKAGYNTELAAGVVCAGGCLGIMIPPSVLLILYGATTSVSVVQLYAAAFVPGFLLAGLYIVYVIVRAMINPKLCPKPPELERRFRSREVFWALLTSFFPLAILILSVLGAILFGLATPSEAAAVGAAGSFCLPPAIARSPSSGSRKRSISPPAPRRWSATCSSARGPSPRCSPISAATR